MTNSKPSIFSLTSTTVPSTTFVSTALVATALVAMTSSAFAETRQEAAMRQTTYDDRMPAVKGGVELGLGANTAHTVGDIGGNMDAADTIGSSAQLDLQVGYRLTPHIALAFYATGQALAEGSTNYERDVYSGSSGFKVDFHFRPDRAVDPWISIGSGVRALLIDADAGTSIIVGAEVARLQLGTDFRLTDSFALGPVVGASATLYGAQRLPMQDFEELEGKGINWTLTAGIAGRFNALGTRL